MKNLEAATDLEIYQMLWKIKVLDSAYCLGSFKKMKQQLEKEWKRRGITVVPLSWDLCPERVQNGSFRRSF